MEGLGHLRAAMRSSSATGGRGLPALGRGKQTQPVRSGDPAECPTVLPPPPYWFCQCSSPSTHGRKRCRGQGGAPRRASLRRSLSDPDNTPFLMHHDQPNPQVGKLRLREKAHSRGPLAPKSSLLTVTRSPFRGRRVRCTTWAWCWPSGQPSSLGPPGRGGSGSGHLWGDAGSFPPGRWTWPQGQEPGQGCVSPSHHLVSQGSLQVCSPASIPAPGGLAPAPLRCRPRPLPTMDTLRMVMDLAGHSGLPSPSLAMAWGPSR